MQTDMRMKRLSSEPIDLAAFVSSGVNLIPCNKADASGGFLLLVDRGGRPQASAIRREQAGRLRTYPKKPF